MSGIKYVIDSNILIELLKNTCITTDKFSGINLRDCAYCAIMRMELLGYPDITVAKIKIISALLSQMLHISVDKSIEDVTITFKQNTVLNCRTPS